MALVNIHDIAWNKRKRKFFRDNVERLKQSIESEGQGQPIIVRRVGKKACKGVAGMHRWTAMLELGWKKVEVKFQLDQGTEELNDIADELMEIDENFSREPLTPSEWDAHLVEREELHIKRAILVEAREAELRKLEAEKALAEAVTAEQKTKAKKEKKNADQSVRDQQKKTRKSAQSSVRSRRGVQEATDEVMAVTGMSKRRVQERKNAGRKLEELAKLAGVKKEDLVRSSIDTKSELVAMAKLMDVDEKQAVKTIRLAAKGKSVKGSTELKAIERKYKQREKAKERETERGAYKQAAELITPVLGNVVQLVELCVERQFPASFTKDMRRVGQLLELHLNGCKIKAAHKSPDVESVEDATTSLFEAPKSKRQQSKELGVQAEAFKHRKKKTRAA